MMLCNMNRFAKSRGQTIVVVAFSLIVTLLCAGLAIDGGNTYHQRRRMQNAADAGALAGARVLATQDSNTYNAHVLAAVRRYVRENAPDASTIVAFYVSQNARMGTIDSYHPGSCPPTDAVGVQVYVGNVFTVFFSGVLRLGQKRASAEAVAKYGAVTALDANQNCFPVAFPEPLVRQLETAGGVRQVRLWEKNARIDVGDPWPGSNFTQSPNSQTGWIDMQYIYNRDFSKPSRWDLPCPPILKANGLGYEPCTGSNVIKYYARYPYPMPLFAGPMGSLDGDFMSGKPGVNASVLDTLTDLVGRTVWLPLYDYTKEGGPKTREGTMSNLFSNPAPDPDFTMPNGTGTFESQAMYYHIVGFAQFKLIQVVQGGSNEGWYVVGEFVKRLTGQGGISGSTGGGTTAGLAAKTVALAEVNYPVSVSTP